MFCEKVSMLFLSDVNETSVFSSDCRKELKYQILSKSVIGNRVVPCAQTDRRT
jgi:hypothetical protein